MIQYLFTYEAIIVGLVGIITVLTTVCYWLYKRDRPLDIDVDEDGVASFDSSNIETSKFEIVQAARKAKKKRKLLDKGYIQWFLVDDSFPEPKFVKPKTKDGGIPELGHKNETYLFPREARLPSKLEGIWTYIHRKGESEPINLSEPNDFIIPAAVLNEYLTLKVSSSPPKKFGLPGLNMDSMDILRYGVLAIIAAFLIIEVGGQYL